MPWAIALVAPNSERHVAYLLARFQFPFHIFWERQRVVHRGRIRERIKPLFSRYAFIRPAHIYDICSRVNDVYRAVSFGEELALVQPSVVQALVDSADHDVLPYSEPVARFRDGTQIVVTGSGPLAGRSGIYRRTLRHERALIMVDIFGRMVPAEVDETDLDAASAEKRRRRERRRRRRHHRHYALQRPKQN